MYVVVDCESDGPIPGPYSMIAIGAVVVEPELNRTFLTYIKPISDAWQPEALAVSGFTREQTKEEPFIPAEEAMAKFANWLKGVNNPRFISDNNGYDWSFINWYFHKFYGLNPFGFSSQNLNSLWKGFKNNLFSSFKKLRKTKHDHNPVNDAKGNAEALLAMVEMFQPKGWSRIMKEK